MPGFMVHVGALVSCPHAGTVNVPSPSQPRVFVNDTQAVLTAKEIHTVTGCTFQVPVPGGTKPQPCVSVHLEHATKVLVNGSPRVDGSPAVILSSAAICQSAEQIPQGQPNSSPIQKLVIAT